MKAQRETSFSLLKIAEKAKVPYRKVWESFKFETTKGLEKADKQKLIAAAKKEFYDFEKFLS